MTRTPFEEALAADIVQQLNVNGKDMPHAIWNLILSKRDLKLWSIGLKPHRHWKVTDVKNYFGLKGNKLALVEQINALVAKHVPKS